MDDNKITISWDELRTRQVEQRVSAMQAMRRNREYAQVTDAAPEEPRKFKSLWYNAVVYMTAFGLLGGLLAWTCGTILRFKNSDFVEASVFSHGIEGIEPGCMIASAASAIGQATAMSTSNAMAALVQRCRFSSVWMRELRSLISMAPAG